MAIREDAQARSIDMEHFYRAVRETVPSVTKDTQAQYEQLARRVKQQQSRIGFRADD